MSRTRATALALVNWKGVFYERYLLDRHVTALEGANGAGKTTVMIAAYVVLLPDMSRLRFTNLGETGATSGDKGIWGRLGEPERPSYAALELEISSGERLIMGVHLERKSEPSVEPTAFIVTGLANQYRLQDLLLPSDGEADQVPLLPELKVNAERLGCRLEVFDTTKDYFASLFERGVTPLRLASDEDRNKLNEMLRTSMTGGISRALTSELRSFLLKEETGLADTLSRMRGNLDACRRTRIEVAESRRLEQEINGIYDAGQSMFAAAVFATREQHEEASRRVLAAEAAYEQASERIRDLEALVQELAARRDAMADRLATLTAARDGALERRDRILRARAIGGRLNKLRAELGVARRHADEARVVQEAAVAARLARRAERDRAQAGYDRAARGLADFQRGLEELHRRAHAFRYAERRLREVRRVLGEPDFDIAELDRAGTRVAAELARVDAERSRLDRECQSAGLRRQEYEQALAALRVLTPEAPIAAAHAEARAALNRLGELEALAARLPELSADAEQARGLATRQAAVRERAALLGIQAPPGEATAAADRQLQELENDARAQDELARRYESTALEASHVAARARQRLSELELRAARYEEIDAKLTSLERAAGLSGRGPAALVELRGKLTRERDQSREQVRAAAERRQAALNEAALLEAGGGALDPELLRLRDELDAELLAGRFEDLELAEAARLQAALGPLAEALIVEDVEAAAERILGERRELPSVWLVPADAGLLTPTAASERGGDVLVREGPGVRISRLPRRPTLGRRARERQAEELRSEATACETELEKAEERVRQRDAWLADVELLLAEARWLDGQDPREQLETERRELEQATEREREARESARAAWSRRNNVRSRVEALRPLLLEVYLLDGPDYAERAQELNDRRLAAVAARAELARSAEARRTLGELLDVLRAEPLSEARLAELRAERAVLDRERDRWFEAVQLVEELRSQAPALAWTDAEAALGEQAALVPALEEQLGLAEQEVATADAALSAAEGQWESAIAAAQQAEAAASAVQAHVERVEAELGAEGVDDQSEHGLTAAEDTLTDAERELRSLSVDERALGNHIAVHEERLDQGRRALGEARTQLEAEQERAEPARAAWDLLREIATSERLLKTALTPGFMQTFAGRGSVKAWAEAQSRKDVLLDRLAAAHGDDVIALVRQELEEEASGQAYLRCWRHVRDWLKRRVPAQVAEVDEPLEALERLRDHLSTLEDRLARQEGDLRGASEDVARSIEVQLRRAKAQVRRLNQHLETVRFGSITGIRVQMVRVERMDQVLRALREGAAQELLFQPTLPIEDALNEIFRRYGGGRTGGQRLLDYREYVELSVEIQRQTKEVWEHANPTRLSTGEAIGVGAALMMVVLTEWERDANLLRPKRAGGSLRFLFLDEANRLSQDNLGVLFDLCQTLDLQLLIAAPEVARAEGNTTYRLVRRVTDDGREEVIVSGRRTIQEPAPEPEPAEAQPELFDAAELSSP